MLDVKKEHLDRFREIKKQFFERTKVPEEDNWRSWANDDIWLYLIEQIIVVGNSKPAERFNRNLELRNQVSYQELLKVKDEEDLKKKINYVLRAVGTRYASSDISKCRKTNALVHNFKFLKSFKEGPKGLLKKLSEFEGEGADRRRIKYLMKNLKYMQSKSARDFLMELGIVRDAIALDVRVQNIFAKVGIKLLEKCVSNPKLYEEIESEILAKVCKPLNLLGVEFDRMLYQNYESIMKMKFE